MSDSIGNLKNSGLQGNNWPWQHKVLLGLDCICNGISQYLAPQNRTPNVLSDTGIGTVPLCYGFSIANVGSTAGTVDGQPLPAGATINFDPSGINNSITGLGYDATGTTFLITWIS